MWRWRMERYGLFQKGYSERLVHEQENWVREGIVFLARTQYLSPTIVQLIATAFCILIVILSGIHFSHEERQHALAEST